MIPTADIIRALLIQESLGSSDTEHPWPVFVGFLPDLPNNAICVYDTAGIQDGRLLATGEQIEHPGIQIRLRGTLYWDSRNKIESIAKALDLVAPVTVVLDEESTHATYLVHNVSRTGCVLSLGAEQTDLRRFDFTINAVTTITEQE